MSMKARITRELSKATSDKAELNKTVLKWKKHFDEAGKVIGADRKKEEVGGVANGEEIYEREF